MASAIPDIWGTNRRVQPTLANALGAESAPFEYFPRNRVRLLAFLLSTYSEWK
jgi:hypothetical protein